MANIPGIRRLFRLPQSEARAGRDVQDEIAFHLEMRIAELESAGLGPAAARRQAEREFGDVEAAEAELVTLARRRARQNRRAEVHEWAWRDLRYGFRTLRRDGLFTAGVVLTLALGVGANAAMFGVTDRVLFQPPAHVRAPDDVVRVYFQERTSWGDLNAQVGYAYREYRDLAEHSRQLELAAYQPTTLPIGRGATAEIAEAVAATAEFFPLLGVAPALGRFFTAEEDVPKAASQVAVLGWGYWQRRFGGSTAVLGETLEIGDGTYTVVGVAPRGFNGLDLGRVDVYVPASAVAETYGVEDWHETHRLNWLLVAGRLRPGATRAAATDELTRLQAQGAAARGEETYGDSPDETALLAPLVAARGPAYLRDSEQQAARVALLLLGVAAIVLLVACANVANLLLSRAVRRTRELAIQVALGVTRVRLLSLVVSEALLLSIAGGLLGLAFAWGIGRLLAPMLLPNVDWAAGVVAPRVVLFAGALVFACTLLISIIPALHAMRTDIITSLRSGAREGGGRRARARAALVVAQAGLSVVLLVGAGLFVRSLQRARAVDFGFDGRQVAVLSWNTRVQARGDSAWSALHGAAAEVAAAVPGASAVARAAFVPGRSNMNFGGLVTGDGDTIPPLEMGGPYMNAVDPAFFRTLGIRVLRGRGFSAADAAGGAPVMVVDQAFAQAVWPGLNPIGRCVRVPDPGSEPGEPAPCLEVVGVVENAMRHGVAVEPAAQFFRPLAQAGLPPRAVFVRSRDADASPLLPALRDRVQRIAPDLPFTEVRTLASHFEAQLRPWRMGVALLTAFGGLALLVAAVGLYSIMAYSVTLRRRELGVRQALGARADQLLALVLRNAGAVLVGGILLGITLALLAAGAVRPLLFEQEPRDPVVLAVVSLLLLVVGLLATLLPARRAARVQAATVLREE